MVRIKDGYYGSTSKDGTWNGIIGELHRHRIDLSIVDLSVTSERMQVIYIYFQIFRIPIFSEFLSRLNSMIDMVQVVDFANGMFTASNGLFMKIPDANVSWQTFIDVFHANFWSTYAGVFVTFVIVGIILSFRYVNKQLQYYV